MKTKRLWLITLVIAGMAKPVKPQLNQWTWVSGSNAINQNGNYGTKGVPGPANVPGARYTAVSWTGTAGELWLFGGSILNGSGSIVLGNDLWKWDGSNWTWVSGSSAGNQNGVYGTKGIANAANFPGSRQQSVSWKDGTGNLWLWGGFGYSAGSAGYLNDCWRWDGTNWTWVNGTNTINQSGIYGTKGVANAANAPGSRRSSHSWVDGSGNFWLLGGYGYDAAGTLGYLNDLWRWNGTTWTWISGTNTVNQSGTYGTKGVANAANSPGSREEATGWVDGSGNAWLFGGYGYNAAGVQVRLNDLWRWDGASWTWISGTNTGNVNGIYGTRGLAAPANMPGSRAGVVSWKDNDGNFWLMGGIGDGESAGGQLNDTWFWNGTQWTWAAGSKEIATPGVYGTLNTPSASNMPGARGNALAWTDATGNFWLFGGLGMGNTAVQGRLNDLWTITPSTLITLPLRLVSFTGNRTPNGNLLQWKTADELNVEKFMVEKSENGTSFNQLGEILARGTGAAEYSYTDNFNSTGRIFYRLKIADRDGKIKYSQVISISNTENGMISIYPNPSAGLITIEILKKELLGTTAGLYDVMGKKLKDIVLKNHAEIIHLETLLPGLYILKLADGSSYKLIKE